MIIFDGSSCFETKSLPNRVYENIIVVSCGLPHRKPTQTHVLDELVIHRERAGIVASHYNTRGLVVHYRLSHKVIITMTWTVQRDNVPLRTCIIPLIDSHRRHLLLRQEPIRHQALERKHVGRAHLYSAHMLPCGTIPCVSLRQVLCLVSQTA
jgi:hypothetical protein